MDLQVFVPIILGHSLIKLSYSDSESSDDDEDEFINVIPLFLLKMKKRSKQMRIENYLELVRSFTACQFQQNFRITSETYEYLLNILGPQLRRTRPVGRHTINEEKQVLAVIWLLATPESYRSVGERFNMGKSSLSVAFFRVVKALCHFAPQIIKWPRGQYLELCKEKFNRMGRLRNVVGCVDGTYIPIKAPQEDPQSYITRKCNYAFTMQAITDPFLKFTDIFVGFPGSVSDTRIFRNSDIYQNIQNNVNGYCPNREVILGDKAYPVLQWCIVPYIDRHNLTPEQIYFNTALSKVRQVVERSFALYFGRFRRMKYVDMNKTKFIPFVALAVAVLHNICASQEDPLLEEYVREGIAHVFENDIAQNVGRDVDEQNNNLAGENIRNEMCQDIFRQRNHRNENE